MSRKLTLSDLEIKAKKAKEDAARYEKMIREKREAELKPLYKAVVNWRDAYRWTTEKAIEKLNEYTKSANANNDNAQQGGEA